MGNPGVAGIHKQPSRDGQNPAGVDHEIGKIEKAKWYAQERTRMRVTDISVQFHGENGEHNVTLAGDAWHCDCDFFDSHHACAHTMALEKVLQGMLPPDLAVSQHMEAV